MALVSFAKYVDSEGISFGAADEIVEQIGRRTKQGFRIVELLDDNQIKQVGLGKVHLLRIRRAWWRYFRLLQKGQAFAGKEPINNLIELAAVRWASDHFENDDQQRMLRVCFSAVVTATLKHGRLRFHLTDPGDPQSKDYGSLAEQSVGCDEIPPHRWLLAARGVTEKLIWVDVIPPDDQVAESFAQLGQSALKQDLLLAIAKPVLDYLTEKAQRRVIASACDALYSLLSRPVILGPVAGVIIDSKRCWCFIDGGDYHGEEKQFSNRQMDQLINWLVEREIEIVALVRVGGRGFLSGLINLAGAKGISVELIREAGLMLQARQYDRPIKQAAAMAVAKRLKDPLEGYAECDVDSLGLGEYLDRVDSKQLKAALQDTKDVVVWERQRGMTGKTSAAVARGVQAPSMVKGLQDLHRGMELTGTVSNITHFGAFVELGLPVQGMIHLSELSDKYISHPSEVVQVGGRIKVRVLNVDLDKMRISLSLRQERVGEHKKSFDKRADALSALNDLFKK
jgi:predicted RNA-binding protein with RPS1 domain